MHFEQRLIFFSLHTDFDPSAPRVKVDIAQMKQVIFNIVRNACDSMSSGGELRVSITQSSHPERQVRVEVEDTGQGIEEQYLDRIFDPFFSLQRTGTGLGLAISKKIVENHKGRIEVKSKPKNGANFGIVLPTI